MNPISKTSYPQHQSSEYEDDMNCHHLKYNTNYYKTYAIAITQSQNLKNYSS